uniref:Small integral membrane protein 8 n=1 Tax=Aplanochytrium stocchinoi TaxID=215587 RepID=A0A6S8FP90_9STRA
MTSKMKVEKLVPMYRAGGRNFRRGTRCGFAADCTRVGRMLHMPRQRLNQEAGNINRKQGSRSLSKASTKGKPASQSQLQQPSTFPNHNSDARGPDATTFFKLTNPEMFMDTNKRSTWYLVGAVWIFLGSYTGYLFYKDSQKDKDRDTVTVGPRKRNGDY